MLSITIKEKKRKKNTMKIQINFKMFDTITVHYLQQNNGCNQFC